MTLLPQFRDEDVTLLIASTGATGPLGGKGQPNYSPGATHQALVTALGAAEAIRLGLTATAEQFRVRLPAGVTLVPGDRLRFRGRDWKAVQVSVRTSYTRVIVEGVR